MATRSSPAGPHDAPRLVVALLLGATAFAGCVGQIGETEGGDGTGGSGGTGGAVMPPPQGNPPATDLPCDVETVLSTRCWSCHGPTPMLGLPALTSVAAFMAPSLTVPSQSTGTVAVARMQSTTSPMPPAPNSPATAAEIATLSNWVNAGYPAGSACGGGGPVCTSNMTWTGGNQGSGDMNPGQACISCHARGGEGPIFSIAGTVYPTLNEPDLCYGANSSSGAHVVITGADGLTLTLTPNAAGNFYSQMAVALPFSAKVVTAAGTRAMVATQTSGDCNSCHTQAGVNMAPGRIMLP
ncbi:MAG TPA: hypothetical protein VKQ32_27670 [Polyangia bacterium]|nr:hypothetical protein [Polyangia bacterium]